MKNNIKKAIAKLLIMSFIITLTLGNITPAFAKAGGVKKIVDKKIADNIKKNHKEKIQVLVKYKNTNKKESVKNKAINTLGLEKLDTKKTYKRSKIDILEIETTDDINAVVQNLRQNPEVEYAQPNYKLKSFTTSESAIVIPNDAQFANQWMLNDSEAYGISAQTAWGITKGAEDVVVGILDTGIDTNHPDLQTNIFNNTNEIAGNGIDDDGNGYIDDVKGWDFFNSDNTVYDNESNNDHGTHIAGIIAATQNTIGISGTAPNVKILPLKFLEDGEGYTSDAIAAIEYAKQMGIDIINASFGGYEYNPALKDAMKNSGILFVCAAGNDGQDTAITPIYPAAFDINNILSVAASDNTGNLANFSNYGQNVDLAAPGYDVLSTLPNNQYGNLNGTSMAAPFVTAVAGLIKSEIADAGTGEIKARILNSAKAVQALSGKTATGGLLNAYESLVTTITDEDIIEEDNNEDETNGQTESDGKLTTLAVVVSPALLEQIHYGEKGVNVSTGNYSKTTLDMSMKAPGFTIDFTRTYNSKSTEDTLLGKGWTFGFEAYLEHETSTLTTVKLPNGKAQVFVNDNGTYTANDSRSTLVKNSDNTHVLTTKDGYTYTFNTSNKMIKMQDKKGNAVNMTWDGDKIIKVTDEPGRAFNITYDSNNKIQAITDPMGRTVSFEYTNGVLTRVTDPQGYTSTYTYNGDDRLISITNNTGFVVESITYDTNDASKVATYNDALGNTFTYTYNTSNKKTTITDSNDREIIKWYDDQYYVTKTQDPEDKTAEVSYYEDTNGINKYGEEHTITDRTGNMTEYVRDNNGNIEKIIYPNGAEEIHAYDTHNNETKSVSPEGITKFYIYDNAGIYLLKEVLALDGQPVYTTEADQSQFAIKEYQYYTDDESVQQGIKAHGLLKAVIDEENNRTTYLYNANGDTKAISDALGNTSQSEYNIIGWKTKDISPNGYTTSYHYNQNGQLTKIIGHENETTQMIYDENSRKVQEIDPKLNSTTYAYYDNGLLQSKTNALGEKEEYTYDVYGNLKTIIYPNLTKKEYVYDKMNRLIAVGFYENGEDQNIFNRHILETYSYEINLDKTKTTVYKQYIIEKCLLFEGEFSALDTSTESPEYLTTTNTYDFAGRLIKQVDAKNNQETIEYNQDGRISKKTHKNNAMDYYHYDKAGRLDMKWTQSTNATIEDGLLVPVQYAYTSYTYNKNGLLKHETKGKDTVALYEIPTDDRCIKTDYTYNANGNLQETNHTSGARVSYTYDKNNNKTSQKIYTNANTYNLTSYTYNHYNKLLSETVYVEKGDLYPNAMDSTIQTALTTTYQYGKNMNLVSKTTPDNVKTTFYYDALNRQIQTSRPGLNNDGLAVTLKTFTTYDTMGNIATVTDIEGKTISYEYDKKNSVIKESLTYKSAEDVEVTDVTAAYEYDHANRKTIEVSAADYVDGGTALSELNRTEYVYDNMNRITKVWHIYKEDGETAFTKVLSKGYTYDASGNKIKEIDGESYNQATGVDEATKISNAYGITYTYDPNNNLISYLNPVDKESGRTYTVKYQYDGFNRIIAETEALGATKGYVYDDAGNIKETYIKTNADAVKQTISENIYTINGNLRASMDALGNVTTYAYNALNTVKKAIMPSDETIDENILTYQYDKMGRLIMQQNNITRTTNIYDIMGRITKTTVDGTDGRNPISKEIKYYINGNVKTEKDGEGNITTYKYDAYGSVIEAKKPVKDLDNNITYHIIANTYDKNGHVLTQASTLQKGSETSTSTTTNAYDALGRIMISKDAFDKTIEKFTYDHSNRQIKSENALLDNSTQYIYDKNGRLTHSIDPEGNTERTVYYPDGNIKYTYDGNNNRTTYTYDVFDNIIQVINAKNETTSYAYDLCGNLISQTNGKGNTTTIAYNAQNLPKTKTWASGKTETYKYNANGTLKEKTDRNGTVTTYAYNPQGMVQNEKAVSISGREDSTLYIYDKNLNVLSTANETQTVSRIYDALGRVLIKSVSGIGSTQYTYDIINDNTSYTGITTALNELQAGETAEISEDPKSNITITIYDAVGRLKSVTSETGTTTYAYYDNGSTKTITYDSSHTANYEYYQNNKLKKLVNKDQNEDPLDDYTYTYDKAGNMLTKTEIISGTSIGQTSYAYDKLNRLKKVDEPANKTIIYQYDKAGNRTLELTQTDTGSNITSGTIYHEYDVDDRLIRTTQKSSTEEIKTTYSYDGNGNLISQQEEKTGNATKETKPKFSIFIIEDVQKGDETQAATTTIGHAYYTYNNFNQLIYSSTGGTIVSYGYNGDGYRVTKTTGGKTTNYLYEYDRVILEVDENNEQKARNVYGINLISRTVDSETLYYMYNGHGDVTALISTVIGEELLTNGDFSLEYTNWAFYAGNGADAIGERDTTTYDEGPAGYKISCINNGTNNVDIQLFSEKINRFKISEGKTYRLTFKAMSVGGNTTARINLFEAESPWTACSIYKEVTIDNEWDKYCVEFVANKSDDLVKVCMLLGNRIPDGGTLYIDSISVREVSDDLISTVATYYYDAFGNIEEQTGNETAEENPYRYAGYQYDQETDLYYLNARYYDSKIARFMQEDTFTGYGTDPLSLNLYTYCANNPIRYYDPTGHIYLQKGAQGDNVSEIQRLLGIDATGVFDEATENAVNQFKDNAGLGNTGVWRGAVGDQTIASMREGKTVSFDEMADRGYKTNHNDSIYINTAKDKHGNPDTKKSTTIINNEKKNQGVQIYTFNNALDNRINEFEFYMPQINNNGKYFSYPNDITHYDYNDFAYNYYSQYESLLELGEYGNNVAIGYDMLSAFGYNIYMTWQELGMPKDIVCGGTALFIGFVKGAIEYGTTPSASKAHDKSLEKYRYMLGNMGNYGFLASSESMANGYVNWNSIGLETMQSKIELNYSHMEGLDRSIHNNKFNIEMRESDISLYKTMLDTSELLEASDRINVYKDKIQNAQKILKEEERNLIENSNNRNYYYQEISKLEKQRNDLLSILYINKNYHYSNNLITQMYNYAK